MISSLAQPTSRYLQLARCDEPIPKYPDKMSNLLLEFDELFDAFVRRDPEYDGLFFAGVRTTGVFCRATCSARKPKVENVAFFEKTSDAILAGFRPCKRCHPMEASGKMPPWLQHVVQACEEEPGRNWKDSDIKRLGIDPRRVRRWFLTHHGITFHYYLRAQRLTKALGLLTLGKDVYQVALDAGYDSLSGFRTAFQQWFGFNAGTARSSENPLLVNRLVSPLGTLVVVCDEETVYLLEFADRKVLDTQFKKLAKLVPRSIAPGENDLMQSLQRQLSEYFDGDRTSFDSSLFIQGTDFQQAVWKELLQIEYGTTASYEQVARKIGRPQAQRAVGRANGENRIAILIPCHRVIRQNGELSGYGGGVRRKEWMLDHEQATAKSAEN